MRPGCWQHKRAIVLSERLNPVRGYMKAACMSGVPQRRSSFSTANISSSPTVPFYYRSGIVELKL